MQSVVSSAIFKTFVSWFSENWVLKLLYKLWAINIAIVQKHMEL